MNKETNLEHYKEGLKVIFKTSKDVPMFIVQKIKNTIDKNIVFGSETGNELCSGDLLDWMAQPYEESVLDDVEKAYLSAVIKPFRNRIRFIVKIRYKLLEQEFIYISVEGNSITFPPFKLGTKYKGMEVNIKYSLEELGL